MILYVRTNFGEADSGGEGQEIKAFFGLSPRLASCGYRIERV